MTYLIAVLVVVSLAFPTRVSASCAAPAPLRVFSSADGQVYFRVVVSRSQPSSLTDGADTRITWGYFYRVWNTEERPLWKVFLPIVPQRVWVDPRGRWVVIRGIYCEASDRHALTVYGPDGLIREWRLSELVTTQELADRGYLFEPHTPWTAAAELNFTVDGNDLRVVLPWGESRVIAPAPPR